MLYRRQAAIQEHDRYDDSRCTCLLHPAIHWWQWAQFQNAALFATSSEHQLRRLWVSTARAQSCVRRTHASNVLKDGAGDRDRTGTDLSAHGILSTLGVLAPLKVRCRRGSVSLIQFSRV
jgi:hypothetical protein